MHALLAITCLNFPPAVCRINLGELDCLPATVKIKVGDFFNQKLDKLPSKLEQLFIAKNYLSTGFGRRRPTFEISFGVKYIIQPE